MFDPLSEKVMNWFAVRYGDRINTDFDFGHSIMLLRGDLTRFRCTRFFGRVFEICCAELMECELAEIGVKQPVVSNVLSVVNGMTSAYARSLSGHDRERLLSTVVKSKIRLSRIEDAENQTHVSEARADLRTSVDQLMLNQPQCGPSKWSSLQAVEKFLKAYIVQRGAVPTRSHKLTDLANAAESFGLRSLGRSTLGLVQCPADVRYNSSLVTREQAVEAHHAALSICSAIAKQLSGGSDWNTGVLARASVNVRGLSQAAPAILIARTKGQVAFNRRIENEL